MTDYLIDRRYLMQRMKEEDIIVPKKIEYVIRTAPIVIPKTTRQITGKWKWQSGGPFYCDNCGKYMDDLTSEILSGSFKYCPSCGARMEF